MNKSSLVIVPCSKLVPVELQAEFGPISPAMIPLDGQPALHYIIDRYPDSVFALAVHEAGEDVRAYCTRHIEDCEVKVLDVGHTDSLGQTILSTLKQLDNLPENLVINFADTALPCITGQKDAIYYSFQEDGYRWTTFSINSSGMIGRLNEKDTEKEDGRKRAFVGVFSFSRPKRFYELLEKYVGTPSEIDSYYEAIKDYFNELEPDPEMYVEAEKWYDFGHLDTYYESRKRLSAVCRHFNTIEVDDVRGTITKRSQNADKFIDEIRWYLKLPRQLQYIAPRVFNYDLSYVAPSIELEFYGYPVLNDLYLYGHLDLGAWSRIFSSIERVLSDMSQFKFLPQNDGVTIKALKDVYEQKTLNRLEEYIHLEEFGWARDESPLVNGAEVYSLDRIKEMLPEVLHRSGVYKKPKICVIHGDLCFSNILYDRRNGIIRTIDPRGSFGPYDIYGDQRYDLCKLSHSIEGGYDFLVNGLFDLKVVEGGVDFSPYLTEQHKEIRTLYRDRILKNRGREEFLRIRLLESLLFLSMIPLHQDRPVSQQAFLASALEIFTQISKELNL